MKLVILDRDGPTGVVAEHGSAPVGDRPGIGRAGLTAMDGYGAYP